MVNRLRKWMKSVCGKNDGENTENNVTPLPKKIFFGLFGIMVGFLAGAKNI